jgi:hypothetical protein
MSPRTRAAGACISVACPNLALEGSVNCSIVARCLSGVDGSKVVSNGPTSSRVDRGDVTMTSGPSATHHPQTLHALARAPSRPDSPG